MTVVGLMQTPRTVPVPINTYEVYLLISIFMIPQSKGAFLGRGYICYAVKLHYLCENRHVYFRRPADFLLYKLRKED